MKIEVQPTARLEAKVRDPAWTLTEEDMPRGVISLPELPHRGDEIEFRSGHSWTVISRTWFAESGQAPLLELGHGAELRESP